MKITSALEKTRVLSKRKLSQFSDKNKYLSAVFSRAPHYACSLSISSLDEQTAQRNICVMFFFHPASPWHIKTGSKVPYIPLPDPAFCAFGISCLFDGWSVQNGCAKRKKNEYVEMEEKLLLSLSTLPHRKGEY